MSQASICFFLLQLLVSQVAVSQAAFVIDFEYNRFGAKQWPTNTIRYAIDETFEAFPNETAQIHRAIKNMEDNTCLRFQQKSTGYFNHLRFYRTKHDVCRGTVGKQPMNRIYGYWRCWSKVGYILHEIMHNLGFRHEHQRPDRDENVKIVFNNIEGDKWRFFSKILDDDHTDLNTAYDPYSVMHYEPTLFARHANGTTMESIRDEINSGDIGHKERGLSRGDIQAIKKLYCTSDRPNQ